MKDVLVRKFENFTRLSPEDRAVLANLVRDNVRRLGPREDLIHEGDKPNRVNLILSGWAYRYKMLEDGRRQIIAFFVPGDMCDLNVFILREMDHSIGTLTPLVFAAVHRNDLLTLMQHGRIAQALWWDTLITAAIQREWTVNLGKRTAFERLGHLFCELYLRLRSVGLASDGNCEFPLTQTDLGDASGLSTVHVNRTLQELRAANLITLRDKSLTIHDLRALQVASLFNRNYLHLDHDGRQLDANVEIGADNRG